MPKSKKPRKKGYAKTYFSPFKVKSEHIEHMKELFAKFSLVAEIKLPRGTCTHGDMMCIRDVFNMSAIAMMTRPWLDQDAIASIKEDFNRAAKAVSAVIVRGEERGRFVCTGEELTSIQDMCAVANDLIVSSFDECPRRQLKEWAVMKHLLGESKDIYSQDVADIKRLVDTVASRPIRGLPLTESPNAKAITKPL